MGTSTDDRTARGVGRDDEESVDRSGTREMPELLASVNQSIHALAAGRLGAAAQDTWDFRCECGSLACKEVVSLTLVDYEALRDSDMHVLAPGHGVILLLETVRERAAGLREQAEGVRELLRPGAGPDGRQARPGLRPLRLWSRRRTTARTLPDVRPVGMGSEVERRRVVSRRRRFPSRESGMSDHEHEGEGQQAEEPPEQPLPATLAGAGFEAAAAAQHARVEDEQPDREDEPSGRLLRALRSFFTRA